MDTIALRRCLNGPRASTLFTVLVPAIWLAYLVPLDLYLSNARDASVELSDLLSGGVLFIGAVTILAVGLISAASTALQHIVASCALLAFIVIVFHSHMPVTTAGQLLDGNKLTFEFNAWWHGTSIMVLLLAAYVAVILPKRFPKIWRFSKYLVCYGVTYPLLLIVITPAPTTQQPTILSSNDKRELTAFSSQTNVLLFVLDTVPSDVAEELLTGRSFSEPLFRDFAFFRDTLGVGPDTDVSMSHIHAVKVYEDTHEDFFRLRKIAQYASTDSFMAKLASHGVHTAIRPDNGNRKGCPPGMTVCASQSETNFQVETPLVPRSYLEFMDVVLLKLAPLAFKPFVYNDGAWMLRNIAIGSQQRRLASRSLRDNVAFEFLATEAHVSDERPVFKYFHSYAPHPPFDLAEDCTLQKPRRASRAAMMRNLKCAFDSIGAIMARLRELGIYDRTAIFVASDHGYVFSSAYTDTQGDAQFGKLAGLANPLLMFKGLDTRREEMQFDPSPVSSLDIGPTACQLLGLRCDNAGVGISLVDPERQTRYRTRHRYYAHHDYGDRGHRFFREVGMVQFRVAPRLWDPASWQEIRLIPAKNAAP